jgi:hypothetical protein
MNHRPRPIAALLALALLTACAPPTPAVPTFDGRETPNWLAYQLDVPGRDPRDLIPAFEASARALGCHTERIEDGSNATIGNGLLFRFHGVVATCELGTIALITLTGDRVRIGCVKPTTRVECDALVEKISAAR